jgi:putative ABC transport system permease protein
MNIMNKVTLKGLLKNKTRTIVTIIGVILSTSMLTAVTTFISSLQNYIINYTIADNGNWHGAIYDLREEDYWSLKDQKEIEDLVLTKSGGYAILEGSQNDYKPYLHVLEIDEKAFDVLPINLISGRLPQNENEVLVSEHIFTNGGVKYEIGDTLTLDLGQRLSEDGRILNEHDEYILGEDQAVIEELRTTERRKFTVVGITKRLSHDFEPYSAAGYTLITKVNLEENDEADTGFKVYFKVRKPKEIYSIMEQIVQNNDFKHYKYNDELLRYMGISDDKSFMATLYSLASILIALIMAGSISLIYNSFAISVSERVKLFGMLSSVGATARQRRNSVYFESLVIAGIGIPFGVISGIAGIGVTLYFLREQLKSLLSSDYTLRLSLSVSVMSVVSAIILAIITIFISASIPARRSRKISPMDAIRQNTDIKLSPKKVKTSKLIRKLFGMEGDIALKNFKRNRRRYRSTVISLFISVVLFVSASAFAMYLKDGVENVYESEEYDLAYSTFQDSVTGTQETKLGSELFQDIMALDGITQGSIKKTISGTTSLPKEVINEAQYQYMVEKGYINDGEDHQVGVTIYSVDHDTFVAYLQELGLDEKQFNDPENPAGIAIDHQHYYNSDDKKYRNTKLFKDESLQAFLLENYAMGSMEESSKINMSVGAFADQAPFGVTNYTYNNSFLFIIDDSMRETGFAAIQDQWYVEQMCFAAQDPYKVIENIKEILIANGMPLTGLFNVAEALQNNRNIITIISVFSYGFIILISLITIANVFNTISTNVNLRRREFAMLKSVGITNRSFNKMLNFECIFYGLKALLYGLPVSIGITYLIYNSLENGVEMGFYLPTQSILISIFSVFLVVFVSMMYSMKKIRHENILDALKNENL